MHITEQRIKNFIVDNVRGYVKFQMIPAALCGLVCSMLSGITALTGITFGIDLFQLIQNPLFIVLVGVMSFVYIITFYTEQLSCRCHVGWHKKFHKGFAIFSGLFAAFLAYSLPQIPLLFNTIAAMSNFDLSIIKATIGPIEVPAMWVLPLGFFVYSWFAKGMFVSMDDKPHLFFTIRKTDLDQCLVKFRKILR